MQHPAVRVANPMDENDGEMSTRARLDGARLAVPIAGLGSRSAVAISSFAVSPLAEPAGWRNRYLTPAPEATTTEAMEATAAVRAAEPARAAAAPAATAC